MNHFVSVIIPACNSEAYLAQCLQSLLEQSYSEYEIVIIDDGSTDRTAAIAASYASEHSCIRLLTQANAGVSAARNHGLTAAKGDYCCFVDSDDFVDPDYLRMLAEYAAPETISVVDFSYNEETEAVLGVGKLPADMAGSDGLAQEYFNGEYGRRIGFSIWNKLFDLRLIRRMGLSFDPNLSIGEDMIFVYRYLSSCRQTRVCDQPLYHYRVRGDSVMNAVRADYLPAYLRTYAAMKSMAECGEIPSFRTVSEWSAEVMKYILTNRYVAEMGLSAFSAYYCQLRDSELARCIAGSSSFHAVKKDMIRLALRCRGSLPLYLLIKMNGVLLSMRK